jgi:hypothetical protein
MLVIEDTGASFQAFWKSLAFFQRGEAPLYPNGLLELLLGAEASPGGTRE